MGPSGFGDVERFWSYVDQSRGSDGCWLWMGSRHNQGYGQFAIKLQPSGWVMLLAHRFSFMLERGPIIGEMFICHHCDVRSCVNPWHLFEGTPQSNMTDKVQKGRQLFGELVPNGKLTEPQAKEIIAGLKAGMKQREIASMLGVALWLVKDISRGRTWRHLQEGH